MALPTRLRSPSGSAADRDEIRSNLPLQDPVVRSASLCHAQRYEYPMHGIHGLSINSDISNSCAVLATISQKPSDCHLTDFGPSGDRFCPGPTPTDDPAGPHLQNTPWW